MLRTIPYLFLVMILLCINHSFAAAASGEGDGETLPFCESITKSYPKEETDLKDNLYTMNLSSVECECNTSTNGMSSIKCTYAADGTSDTGSTKYDWVDCIAIVEGKVCYKIPEGECKEPTDWKEHELFEIAKFEQEVFDPWCFVSIEENTMNGSSSSSTVLLIRKAVMIMVTSMIAWA